MADIRINALATTATSSASDDYVAIDGSANGTRKLSAYSPTFGGNLVTTGTLTVNSTTDSTSKDTGAIITEGGLGVEKSATIGGQLTVSGTGVSAVSGALQVSGFYNGFYDTSIIALGSATKNPRITLGSTSAYRWSLLNNDVGGNGEFVVRYEEGPINALSVTRSGNVGIGVTPSSWSSAHPAIQFKNSTAISSYSSIDGLELTSNGYADGATTWKYIETYTAAQYVIGNGAHKWYSAASGTADTAITWSDPKLTLTNGGNFLVGTPTDAGQKLQVAGDIKATGDTLIQGTSYTLYSEIDLGSLTSGRTLSSVAGNMWLLAARNTGSISNYVGLAYYDNTANTQRTALRVKNATALSTVEIGINGEATTFGGDATFAGKVTVSNGADLFLTNSTYTMRANVNTIVGNPAIWFRDGGSPSSSNYSLSGDGTNTNLNATAGGSVELRVGNGTALKVDSNKNVSIPNGSFGIATSTPASASATGTTGTIAWDASYIYVCTATNTWKRAAIATW